MAKLTQKNYEGMPLYNKEVSAKEVMSDREAARQEDAEVHEASRQP